MNLLGDNGYDFASAIKLARDMRCHVGIAVGLGVASLGAGIYSSVSSANAQKSAANKAAQSVRDANDANLRQFQLSRGLEGSAVLPLYLQGNGGLFEGQLGQDLVDAYNGSGVSLDSFKNAIAPLKTAQDRASQFTNDIFTGGITNRLLGEAAPVQAARLASARSSSMDALNKTLDAIDAAQAGKGFSGDSYGNRMLRFQGRKFAGDAVSAANLQNLSENQQIENYGNVSLPMNNLALPASMAKQAGDFAFMPQSDWLQSLQSRVSPLSFLRIGTSAPFQFQNVPTPPPIPSAGGLAASGIAQGAGSALNYYLQQQQQQQLLNSLRPAVGGPAGGASGYVPSSIPFSSSSDFNLMSPQPTISAPPDFNLSAGF